MRKGMTLIELLMAVLVMGLVWVVFSQVFAGTMGEMPRDNRILGAYTTLTPLLEQMRKDVDAAQALPSAAGPVKSDEQRLLIQRPEGMVCYEWRGQEIVRTVLAPAEQPGPAPTSWPLPKTKVQWRLWARDGANYAVEVRTAVDEENRSQHVEKLANAHVFFLGAMPGVEVKP